MARDLAEVLKFGRYEPLFRIGLGGMAEVYAARILGEGGFQKQVAVKRMLPHLTGDQKFVDMFLDEARLAANISSPHVVQTLDLGRAEDESLYIVMELIVGVNLSQVMIHLAYKKEHIEPTIGLELLSQAAQGLDDAHEAHAPNGSPMHLVHRDVSPQNILVGIDGRARMTDFGIAHALHLRQTHTRAGEKKGKFSYFSPEQASDEAIDRRSDVFALGVVAWEVMTGRRLFRGNPMEALELVQTKDIPLPHRLRPDLSEEASDVIMLALERNRDRRYATAGQFASALKRAALGFGELPSPRVIGRFVEEAGGEQLARIRETIAQADAGDGADEAGPTTSHTEILPEGTPTPSDPDPDATWVPGRGATSLITGERTFTGGVVLPPIMGESTLLLDEADTEPPATVPTKKTPPPAMGQHQVETALIASPLHDASTVIVDEAITDADMPGTDPLDAAPTTAWSAQVTTATGLRRMPSRSWKLAFAVGGVLLLGGVGFAVALAATFDDGAAADEPFSIEPAVATPAAAEGPESGAPTGVVVPEQPDEEEGAPESELAAETGDEGPAEAQVDAPAPLPGAEPEQALTAGPAATRAARRRERLRRERLRRERERREQEQARMPTPMPTPMPTAMMTTRPTSGLPSGLDW